jgi:hypothetical protein
MTAGSSGSVSLSRPRHRRPRRGLAAGFPASVPSWRQAPLGDDAPEAFVIETVNLGGERESLFSRRLPDLRMVRTTLRRSHPL